MASSKNSKFITHGTGAKGDYDALYISSGLSLIHQQGQLGPSVWRSELACLELPLSWQRLYEQMSRTSSRSTAPKRGHPAL